MAEVSLGLRRACGSPSDERSEISLRLSRAYGSERGQEFEIRNQKSEISN
jgi:hypothetical protein